MALTETRRPYEFLARWDPATGDFRGAHVQFIDVIERDGVQLSATPSKAFGVGEGAAFPLADILAQVQIDTLAALSAAQAQVTTLTAELTAAQQAEQQALAGRAQALAQLATAVAEIEALHGAAAGQVVDGVPQSITPAQGEEQLRRDGLLQGVLDYIGALPQTDPMSIAYRRAQVWDRSSPAFRSMLQMLGKTDAEADAFFVAAAAITL